MTHEQGRTPMEPLTEEQRTRLDFARRDLESARAEDLARLPADGLILLVENLRHRLDDTLRVIDDVTSAGNGSP
jgi:hypothetical protein